MELRTLLLQQQQVLEHYFCKLDLQEMAHLLDAILACRGALLLSGVGKSGQIAEKIASTFRSFGKKAHFLSPLEAAHGALGMVSSEDLFWAFSKSGETKELIALLPLLRVKGLSTIACVSRRQSSLATLVDRFLFLPVAKELCPHDLAPTTSTTVQLLAGDCLAIAWMQKQGVTVAQFAENHPGGLLGIMANRAVSDLMLQGEALPIVSPDERVIDALVELSFKRCGALLVVNEQSELLGIFTDGDLRRLVQREGTQGLEATLRHVMNATPKTIGPQVSLHQAIEQMEEGPLITVLPVVQGRQLLGLVRLHDILQTSSIQNACASR